MSRNIHIAERMQHIQPFFVMDLLARAQKLEAGGHSIIHMEVGEPDFSTPASIVDAGMEALSSGKTHYTPATGLPVLRKAIAEYYLQHHGVEVSPERIIVTPGASGALQLAVAVLVNPGEQVLMADPGYPCNRHFVYMMNGEPVTIPVDATTDFQLTAELIDRNWQPSTIAALIASPSNPTGTMVNTAGLADIIQAVDRHDGRLIVDEIYHGLIYEGKTATALSLSDEVFVINSFSKYFGMTGWRLGWLVAPQSYVNAADRLAQNIFLAASTLSQYAALQAFEPETIAVLEQRRREFQQRRDYLLPALRDLGFVIEAVPQGAFYLYADCSAFTSDSFGFAGDVLDKAHVAITPGKDFGHNAPQRYVRFAYTTSLDKLKEGVRRLAEYLGK